MTVRKPRAKPRRSLRSPEREQAIVNALRVGNTRRAAAAAAEVSKDTFYRWLEDATFCDAVEKAEADAELRFLGVIAKAAPIRWQAAAWWLERRRHEEYGRRDRVETSIDIQREIELIAAEHGLDPAAVEAEVKAMLSRQS
jgi:hypothetical protein